MEKYELQLEKEGQGMMEIQETRVNEIVQFGKQKCQGAIYGVRL